MVLSNVHSEVVSTTLFASEQNADVQPSQAKLNEVITADRQRNLLSNMFFINYKDKPRMLTQRAVNCHKSVSFIMFWWALKKRLAKVGRFSYIELNYLGASS